MKWTYTVNIKRVLHMAWPKVTAGISRSNAGVFKVLSVSLLLRLHAAQLH